jgi:hypothetical protein
LSKVEHYALEYGRLRAEAAGNLDGESQALGLCGRLSLA